MLSMKDSCVWHRGSIYGMPKLTHMRDIEEKLALVDAEDVLSKVQSDPLLQVALEMSRPPNWWGTGLSPQRILPIAEDGIPVKWIPGPAVIKELVAAQPGDRVDLLRSYEEEIIAECHSLVDECSGTAFGDVRLLALRSIDTFAAGYFEAATALAVAVAEGLALWASRLRAGILASLDGGNIDAIMRKSSRMYVDLSAGYRLARKELDSGILNHDFDVPRQALIAPIPKFFTPFYPGRGDEVPVVLSRHVVAHQPTVEHFSPENSIMAIMLTASLLKERDAHRDYDYIDID